MPPTSEETLAQVRELIDKGEIAKAQELLAALPAASSTPGAATAVQAPPPPPRKPEEVALSLFEEMARLLGNHPALDPLLAELRKVLGIEHPASGAKPVV